MNNIVYFIILLLLILGITYLYGFKVDSFDVLSQNPSEICNNFSKNVFMIRDINTKYWLNFGSDDGYAKFIPSGFGVPLVLSDKPNENLPLRLAANPNDYLLATYNKEGIRIVSNPYTKYNKIEIYIFNSKNILGFTDESDNNYFIEINDDGSINVSDNPNNASKIEMIFV
jgi:hypothetical protein